MGSKDTMIKYDRLEAESHYPWLLDAMTEGSFSVAAAAIELIDDADFWDSMDGPEQIY